MSALVMGLGSEQPVAVDDAAFIATSFPGFADLMRCARRGPFMIIAIDGPAASGKGTLGKRLAAHYGLRHLDTGLLYRAVAKAVLDAGHAPDDAARAVAAAKAHRSGALRRDRAEALRGRRGGLGGLGDPGGARGAVRVSAGLRRSAARRGARRPRHRHGDLPQRRREDFRHRLAGGPGAAAAPTNCAAGARTADEADVLADILRRDERDRSRSAAPLSGRGRASARHHAPRHRGSIRRRVQLVEARRSR